jgi:hypothetical protein
MTDPRPLRTLLTRPAIALVMIPLAIVGWIVASALTGDRPDDRAEEDVDSIARELLGVGRGDAAWEVLSDLVRPDAEAYWLLSRAALQLGETDWAESSLAEARSLGLPDDPMRAEPSPYVGSSSCVECHGAISREQGASRHARSLGSPSDLDPGAIPDDAIPDPESPEVFHRFLRDDDGLTIETEAGGERFRAVVAHLMGSGNHGITPVGIGPGGNVVELRLSHYGDEVGWDLTTGHPEDPGLPIGYLGRLLGEDEQRACLGCHTTPRPRDPPPSFDPPIADGGIRCERCHGPAGNHVAAIRQGLSEPAIARPKMATAEQVVHLCGDCHRPPNRGPQPESSDPNLVRFQAETFVRSACFAEAPPSSKFDCVSCHDPHHSGVTDVRQHEAVCLSCHSGGPAASPPMLAESPEHGAIALCPIDREQGCISCHMPRRESSMRHTRFTDHHIRVHPDLDAIIADPAGASTE